MNKIFILKAFILNRMDSFMEVAKFIVMHVAASILKSGNMYSEYSIIINACWTFDLNF